MKSTWIVGTAAECDIVVAHPKVSPRHCQLVRTAHGLTLTDLDSRYGTFVNGIRATGPMLVSGRDEVLLAGCVLMPWPKPAPNHLAATTAASASAPTARSELLVGRDQTCDIVIDLPSVSRQHAKLVITDEQLFVEDLKSANGTFLNGLRISVRMPIRPGDQLGFGDQIVEVQADGTLSSPTVVGALSLELLHVNVDIPDRRLLEDVTLSIYSGEFVGLMGLSGAGKTTLLNAMNGYLLPVTGGVLANGIDLYSHYSQFSSAFGYVPQDDIMHRELTMRQALYFSARVRLASSVTDADIVDRIHAIAGELGLLSNLDTVIGSPERKGISGGQRKRLNLAIELLTDPAILFLDEPTSGLSSEDALAVMKLLRGLADRGKTIVLTVHQPSLEAFKLLDRLIVVGRDTNGQQPGQLVFFGPAYPDSIRFFNPVSEGGEQRAAEPYPDDLLRGLAQRSTDEWVGRYRTSPYYERFVAGRSGRLPARQKPLVLHPPPSPFDQWWTLLRRGLTLRLADRWNTLVLLVEAPVIAVVILLVFAENVGRKVTAETWGQVTGATASTVFLLGLAALWFGASNTVRDIVGEWAIYRRERMVNLQIVPYLSAKLTLGLGLCALQCAILIMVAHWGCGLQGPVFSSFCVMMLIAGIGVALGLVISAVARTSEVAIAVLPVALIPMIVLGGMLQPTHKMRAPIQAIAYVMPTRSAFEAMMLQEANRRPLGPTPYAGIIDSGREGDHDRPDMAQPYFPKNHRLGTTMSVAILVLMFTGLASALYLVLRQRDLRHG